MNSTADGYSRILAHRPFISSSLRFLAAVIESTVLCEEENKRLTLQSTEAKERRKRVLNAFDS